MTKNDIYTPGTFLQFSPCILFLSLYLSLYVYTFFAHNLYNSTTTIISGLPLFSALVTTIYAFFTFKKSISIHEKIKIFLSGSINQSSSYFYSSFIGAATFAHILAKTGAITTMTTISIIALPSLLILPSLFCISSIITMIIRSWVTSIILCMPISYGIALSLQINPALMAATIVSGVICGYQILMPLKGTNNQEVIKEVVSLNIPVSLCTFLVLSMYQYQIPHAALYEHLKVSLLLQDYLTLLPVILFLGAAILGFDLIVNLALGSSSAMIIGIVQSKFSMLDATSSIFEGFYSHKSIVKLLILFVFLSGLTNIINYNKGFSYMIDKLKYRTKNLYLAQLIIILIISIINLIFACEMLSIRILTPMIKKLSDRYNIPIARNSALLSLISAVLPCCIPYAPIILLASDLAHVSCVDIIRYMIYPTLLYGSTIISIFIFRYKKSNKKYYTQK